MTNHAPRWGATILRGAVASIFVVHGVTRLALGTVGGFGGFLGSSVALTDPLAYRVGRAIGGSEW